jgi:hypothetical protein
VRCAEIPGVLSLASRVDYGVGQGVHPSLQHLFPVSPLVSSVYMQNTHLLVERFFASLLDSFNPTSHLLLFCLTTFLAFLQLVNPGLQLSSAQSILRLTSSFPAHWCLNASSTSDVLASVNCSSSFMGIPRLSVGTSSRVCAERFDLEGGNGRSYLSGLGLMLSIFSFYLTPRPRDGS